MNYPRGLLIQFARAPQAGRVKTRLIPALGAQGAAHLHAMLVRHTWHSLTDAALAPVELWTDQADDSGFFDTLQPAIPGLHLQQGASLGERMAHAVCSGLRRSEAVVLVGSDCPVLQAGYLEAAFAALQGGKPVVVGPAADGGYVLIGMRVPAPAVFEDIDWGTAQVLQQTRRRLTALALDWLELPCLWDVDRPEDLDALAGLDLFEKPLTAG